MILSGQAHSLRTRADSQIEHLEFLRHDHPDLDKPPTFRIGSGPVVARVLCGKLKTDYPGDLRRTSIPPVLEVITKLLGEEAPLEVLLVREGAAAMLTRLAQIWLTLGLRKHEDCPAIFEQTIERDPIAIALQKIASDPAADWTVARLAKQVGISRSHFFSTFVAHTGRTPMEMITEHRMRMAERLLGHSHLKIAEIGERVGYSSETAFCRRFKDYFGKTPSAMRRDANAGSHAKAHRHQPGKPSSN